MSLDYRDLARAPARSLLSALLQSAEAERELSRLRLHLLPKDFPVQEGEFFRVLLERLDAGEALDLASLLHDALHGKLRLFSMRPDELSAWLGALYGEAVPSLQAIPAWTERVAEASRRQEASQSLLKGLQAIAEGSEPLEVLRSSRRALERFDGHSRLDQSRVGIFLEEAWARMEQRATQQERPIALPWPSLNRMLAGGFWPGLHVLVGNTGSGKSQFALQVALHAARMDTPVLYVGLELGRVDLVARLLGLMTRRRWSRLYLGQGGPTELSELATQHAEQLAELQKIPFHLDVCPPMGWSYDEIFSKARAMRDQYPATEKPRPFLLVLDFLQLVSSPEGSREELRERIGRAAYAGRAAARDLDAVVLMVSSTSRDNYAVLGGEGKQKLGQGNAARLVGLGKESGEVEYAADSVLVLCRDLEKEAKKVEGEEWSSLWVALAKARAARPDWAELWFNGGWFTEPRSPGTISL
ncbi:MAG TPA: DnaB-like helicase C-terminal domain-containing protein [Myxococcota bacterium]|nr:DnaB-like helicase C-terminal domain-containing protein [Myxococcota bacterium]